MKKINLNPVIKKDTEIDYFINRRGNHIYMFDKILLIEFKDFNLFNKSTRNKLLKLEKEPSKKLEDVYNKTILKLEKYEINTNPSLLYEDITGTNIQILKTGLDFKGINRSYIELLTDPLLNYKVETNNSKTTPIKFTHKEIDIIFHVSPMHLPDDIKKQIKDW